MCIRDRRQPGANEGGKGAQGEVQPVAEQQELPRPFAGKGVQPAPPFHGGELRPRPLAARAERLHGAREARGQQERALAALQRRPGEQQLVLSLGERPVRAGKRCV